MLDITDSAEGRPDGGWPGGWDLDPQSSGEQFSLGKMLWRRKGLLFFGLLCGLAGGYAYFNYMPDTFRSAATIEVVRRMPPADSGSALQGMTQPAPGVAFIHAEMTATEVLEDAIDRGNLMDFSTAAENRQELMGTIRRNLELNPPASDGESSDRTVTFVTMESYDAAAVTAILDNVIQAYQRYLQRQHRQAFDSIAGFFREGRDSLLPKIEKLEQEYLAFRDEAPLEWTPDGQAVNPYREDALRLEEQASELELETQVVANKLSLIRNAAADQASYTAVLAEVKHVLDDIDDLEEVKEIAAVEPVTNLGLETELIRLRVEADHLRELYGPTHPLRRSVESQLDKTEREFRSLKRELDSDLVDEREAQEKREEAARTILRGYYAGMQKQLKLLQQEQQAILNRAATVRDKGRTLASTESRNEFLLRQLERHQELFDNYDNQAEQTKLPQLPDSLSVIVLQPVAGAELVGPLLPTSLAGGGVVGLLLAGLIGFLCDWSERTFRGPDEVSDVLDIRILAHIPLMLFPRKKRPKKGGPLPFDQVDPSLITIHHPHSAGAEAIRSVRTALLSGSFWEPEFQVVQVTSTVPGEGKSMVLANLAVSIANANRKVAVVDADLRHPVQHQLFAVDSSRGLTGVINGEYDWQQAIATTTVEGLSVLPAGRKPVNPAEALMLPDFNQLLDDLRTEFDVVLVDSPPLLAVTDAANVANHVDGVLLVTRIARNCKPMTKRAVTILKGLQTNIIGLVVNAIGDSSYSASYASAWSERYGGQPGSEFGYGYSRYGSRKYLDAPRDQAMIVRGRVQSRENSDQESAVSH